MVAVHKAQGAIEAFRKVKRLREEVSNVDG